jgi:hypothetical protein
MLDASKKPCIMSKVLTNSARINIDNTLGFSVLMFYTQIAG